jgi:hypothetical protein
MVESFGNGGSKLRNIPLQFVAEDTIKEIAGIHEKRERAAAVAQPLGLRTTVVAEHWPAIEQHKWVLSEKLGRDVGAKVAALDYFENFKGDSNRSTWLARAWRGLLENLDGDGPRSLAAFERAMSGTQSLAR